MISTFYNFYISPPHGCNQCTVLYKGCLLSSAIICNKDVLNAVSAHNKQAIPGQIPRIAECAMSTLYELFTFVVRGKHRTLQFHRHLILNRQCLMLSQRIEGGDKSILSILHCNTNTSRFKVHHQKERDICVILSRHLDVSTFVIN